EVLRSVRPADAAAGNAPEAQMHTLDARPIDEDLAKRARIGQAVDRLGIELEGDHLRRPAVCVALIEVRAQDRADEIEEAAQDTVLVETCDRIEQPFRLCQDARGGRLA